MNGNRDHQEFFVWIRIWPHQFRNLYELVHPRLSQKRVAVVTSGMEAGFDPIVNRLYS